MYFLGQEWLNLRIGLTSQILRPPDSCIDALHNVFEKSHRSVFPADDGLPVPLVHIERMQVVKLLISTDSIHVGIDAIARFYLILRQRESLPLGQRVNHLSLRISQILDGEGHSTLHTVQVVIDTQSLQNEQRSRHATQPQFGREVLLKELLDEFNTLFRLLHIEQRFIFYRFDDLSHISVYDLFNLFRFTCRRFCLQKYTFLIKLQPKTLNYLQNFIVSLIFANKLCGF